MKMTSQDLIFIANRSENDSSSSEGSRDVPEPPSSSKPTSENALVPTGLFAGCTHVNNFTGGLSVINNSESDSASSSFQSQDVLLSPGTQEKVRSAQNVNTLSRATKPLSESHFPRQHLLSTRCKNAGLHVSSPLSPCRKGEGRCNEGTGKVSPRRKTFNGQSEKYKRDQDKLEESTESDQESLDIGTCAPRSYTDSEFRYDTIESCQNIRVSDVFLCAKGFQPSDGSNAGLHLVRSLVKGPDGLDFDDMNVQELVTRLDSFDWHAHHSSLRGVLLTNRIPNALKHCNIADAAVCLTSCDAVVQDQAVSCLEQLLLVDRHGCKSSQDLTMVMNTTILVLSGQHGNGINHFHLSHVFLMAACEFLLSWRQPPVQLQRIFSAVKDKIHSSLADQGRKQTSPVIQELEGLRRILKDLMKIVVPLNFPWTCTPSKCEDTDKTLKQATLAHLILCFYSLVSETIKVGWSPVIDKLCLEVNRIRQEISRRRTKKKNWLTFDLFAIRCLKLVLTTTFNDDRQKAPGRTWDSPVKLATVVRQIALESSTKQPLLEELPELLFHPCGDVRILMADLMTMCDQEMSNMFLKHAKANLRLAEIRHSDDSELSSGNKPKQKKVCEWIEKKFWGKDGAKLQGAFYIPKPSCLSRDSITECMGRHSIASELSRQHEQNLEMLRSLQPHSNIVSLLAFQLHPMPYFYVTEDTSECRLLHLLLDRRATHQWLPRSILCRAALDIAEALDFLNSQRIVLRDITTFNMIYNMQESNRRQSDAATTIRVKVAELGLAEKSVSETAYDSSDVIRIFNAGPVPTRWTSPEALCQGEFSWKSMVYAFGFVLYELFTHGCQPFSEMQGRSTADILRLLLIVPECTRPFRWPCFPPEIFELMRKCTESGKEMRPTVPEIKRTLNKLLQSHTSSERKMSAVRHIWRRGSDYPVLDIDQTKRNHEQERGIPEFVRDIAKNKTRYKNLNPDYWSCLRTNKVTDEELYSSDPITISTQDKLTTVQEFLTPFFIEKFLRLFEYLSVEGIVSWSSATMLPQSDHVIQERVYEPAVTLADAARMNHLTPLWEQDKDMHGSTFLAVADCVRKLHVSNWVHRDLRAANILITQHTGKVILARIGRVASVSELRYLTGRETESMDNLRWLSPEAVHLHAYEKENDIFMLGTTFWETYHIRQVCARDPAATTKVLVPFPDKCREEVMNAVQEGVHLPRVPDMPEWIYQLVCECRHPDKEKRPTIADVITRLKQCCQFVSGDQQIRLYTRRTCETAETAPENRTGNVLGSTGSKIGELSLHKSSQRVPDAEVPLYEDVLAHTYNNWPDAVKESLVRGPTAEDTSAGNRPRVHTGHVEHNASKRIYSNVLSKLSRKNSTKSHCSSQKADSAMAACNTMTMSVDDVAPCSGASHDCDCDLDDSLSPEQSELAVASVPCTSSGSGVVCQADSKPYFQSQAILSSSSTRSDNCSLTKRFPDKNVCKARHAFYLPSDRERWPLPSAPDGRNSTASKLLEDEQLLEQESNGVFGEHRTKVEAAESCFRNDLHYESYMPSPSACNRTERKTSREDHLDVRLPLPLSANTAVTTSCSHAKETPNETYSLKWEGSESCRVRSLAGGISSVHLKQGCRLQHEIDEDEGYSANIASMGATCPRKECESCPYPTDDDESDDNEEQTREKVDDCETTFYVDKCGYLIPFRENSQSPQASPSWVEEQLPTRVVSLQSPNVTHSHGYLSVSALLY